MATHIQTLDLTLPQFDIILTLGNTAGMTFKQLGEKTIITKGTLTGIINRLEDKGLVKRLASKTDGRSQVVRLTASGVALFERAFPEHLAFINRIFQDYAPEDIEALGTVLLQLRRAIVAAHCEGDDESDGWCAIIKGVCNRHQNNPNREC